MKIKSLLIFVFTLMSLTAFAQSGGIKGKVVSREGRVAVDGVKVSVTPGEMTATTDGRGGFVIENVEPGEYTLQFEAPEFEPLTLVVRVDKMVRDINTVILVPEVLSTVMDDSIFAEFDTESGNDAQSLPSSLSASKDVFNNIASYRFSEMRFNVRGYDSQYSDVYLNGIRFNDAMTGYTPWSLWSGLNDATRNQEITNGSVMSDYGVGSIGGTTNINARASQVRQGLRVSLVNANSMYRFRAMVTYGSGLLDNGWSYALSVSTRQGGNSYVDGVYYNSYGYFASAEKIFNSRHRLGFTIMGAPTERGAQQASTQEAYDLVGNNYYNPNWGYQDGKMRNARVRNSHEPIAMINYTFDPNEHTQFNLATSFRFGKNGYSALTWYDGADPRPDYYRYMPSYKLLNATDLEAASMAAASLADQWMRNVGNIRHFDWDEMYQTNMNFRNAEDEAIYGPGARSNYIIEERHTDQLDWNLAAQISRIYKDNSRLTAGANVRINRTWYYDEVKDLLGGDYYVDVDKFAQRVCVRRGERDEHVIVHILMLAPFHEAAVLHIKPAVYRIAVRVKSGYHVLCKPRVQIRGQQLLVVQQRHIFRIVVDYEVQLSRCDVGDNLAVTRGGVVARILALKVNIEVGIKDKALVLLNAQKCAKLVFHLTGVE